LQEHVRDALRCEWPAFAARHPQLAAALDETLVVPHVCELLEDDPAYRHALAQADDARATGVALEHARRFVVEWLKRIA
jgi:hypothetical protein